MATTLLARTAQGSHDKTAHHAMLNVQNVAENVAGSVASVRNAVNARNAAGAASVAAAQSAVANAVTPMEMAMPMSKATAEPMRRKLMCAVRVVRNLAERCEATVEGKAAQRVATSAGQSAARVSMTQRKRMLPPTQ